MAKPPTPTTTRTGLLSLRERGLLVIALWVFALLAAIALFRQFRENSTLRAATLVAISAQQPVLDEKEGVEKKLLDHRERLSTAQKLQGAELQALVTSMATLSRLNPEFTQPRIENKNGIQTISIKITFRDPNTTIDKLLRFDDRIRNRSKTLPIIINSVRLDATPRETLNVSYEISVHCISEKTEKKTKN